MTTSDTFDGMIAVIQAFKVGKAIQWREQYCGKVFEWKDIPCNTNPFESVPFFNFNSYEYRIKPEPREFWMKINLGESRGYAYTSAEAVVAHGFRPEECIHVREVIE